MSVQQVSCPARVLLLETEIAELQAVPGGLDVPPTLWCTLETGHGGRHAVAAQFAGGPDVPDPHTVWMLWPEDDEYRPGRQLIVLPPCPVDFLPGYVEEEGCAQYEGHPGRHGWEFGPSLSHADLHPDLTYWLNNEPPDEPSP